MSATTCTLFPEPEEKQPAPLTLATQTDTQTPQPVVPIYLVHHIQQPFCSDPHCACQQHRPYKTALLESVRLAEVTIQRIPGEVTL